jgi:hypothetical protein
MRKLVFGFRAIVRRGKVTTLDRWMEEARKTGMISLDRLAGGQALKETFGEDPPLATRMPATPAIEGKHEDHHNTLDGKVLQKARVLALAPAQTATRPVVAPKLRQNRFKYRSPSEPARSSVWCACPREDVLASA